ncbi:MAG TPA: response regulator transcription factor [Bacteroidia bacterium]|jgi:DNA-binding response OmpR family regulator|nr:response regulator transcription factor [Bacteroidia bacterium]
MRILLVEDELELQKSIVQYLDYTGNIVEAVSEFRKASDKIHEFDYDCILIDINIVNGNGFDLIKELKEAKSKAGIIIISAKNSLDDKITGLDLGADDYLTKPFHLSELNARIKALIRRKNFEGGKAIAINEITIYPDDRRVLVKEQEIDLTATEFRLLLYLITNKNRVVSKNSISQHLLNDDDIDQIDNHNFVYSHLKNLRKKLVEKGSEDYIQTIYGIGYKFKVND